MLHRPCRPHKLRQFPFRQPTIPILTLQKHHKPPVVVVAGSGGTQKRRAVPRRSRLRARASSLPLLQLSLPLWPSSLAKGSSGGRTKQRLLTSARLCPSTFQSCVPHDGRWGTRGVKVAERARGRCLHMQCPQHLQGCYHLPRPPHSDVILAHHRLSRPIILSLQRR